VRSPLRAGLCVLAGAALVCTDLAAEPAEFAPLAAHSLLVDAARVGSQLVAVGERGHILTSPNGEIWTQVAVPTRRMLNAIAADGDEAWAVGHDAVILHSADSGHTWSEQFEAPEDEAPLFDVWVDGDRLLAVGAYGLALLSDDRGETWDYVTIGEGEEDFHIYGISEAPEGDLYVAGEFGALWRSSDRGDTWTRLVTPYEGTYFGVLALGDDGILVHGLRGTCFRSHDNGETWRKVETNTTAALLHAVRLEDHRVLIAGLSGAILMSMDDGRSFRDHNREDRLALARIIELDESRWLLLGEAGAMVVDAAGVR
jgi:photosystem II stability/assembly factor-like uncharacterized protein